MKTTALSLRRASGFTYMTVVVTMIVVGLMLAAYLKLISVQNQMTIRSQTWNRSVPVLEAGIEEAIAHLNKNGSPDQATGDVDLNRLASQGWQDVGGSGRGPWHKWSPLGGDLYFVSISAWTGTTTNLPVVSSTGYVAQLPAFALHRTFSPFVANALDDLVGQGKYSRRIVQCHTTNNPIFTRAIVAKHGIDLNGNRVAVDSFDSSISGRNVNGRWDISVRRDKGDVASNDTATNIIDVGNAEIYGRVSTGPGGSVGWRNGAVGDMAWHAGNVNGIKPGWFRDDMNVEFPDVVMPNVAWSGMPAGGSTNGSTYQYIFRQPGYYQMASGTWTGKSYIGASNVFIRIDGGVNFSGNNEGLVIASNASVRVFLNCSSAKVHGQGVINTGVVNAGKANQCQILGTSALTSLEIGGNGEATCVVYAPYADVKLHGGGNNEQDFTGGLIAKTFKFTGHYNVHYDEALAPFGTWRGFTITSWNEQ